MQALHIWVSIHHLTMFFWCTSLKWWHLQRFFHFFKILVLWVVRRGGGKRAKNGPKWQKIMSHFVSQELYLIWLSFWYTSVKWWYLQQIFSFFQKSYFSGFSDFSNKFQNEILRCDPHPHLCVIFLLNYDLFCPNWTYQRQIYQKVPQIL